MLGVLEALAVTTNTSGPSFAIQGWFAILFLAGIACTSALAVWKVFWPLLQKITHLITIWPRVEAAAASQSDVEELKKLVPLVQTISAEFRNNGGSTLRDAVDDNTATTNAIGADVAVLKQDVSVLKENVTKLQDGAVLVKSDLDAYRAEHSSQS